MRRQIKNPYILFNRNAVGPYANRAAGGMYVRGMGRAVGRIVDDSLWIIEDATSCTIADNVITWNRVTDSFIRLEIPSSFAVGQSWALSYTVVEESGKGFENAGFFISSTSCVRPQSDINSNIGFHYYEATGENKTYLLRWTPTANFDGFTFQIRDVRIYDKNDPGAYP